MRNEDFRRKASLIICWASWACAFLMTSAIVFDSVGRRFGVVVVLFIGLGVTATLVRSRYRLSDTITQVFETGVALGKEQERDRHTRH